MTPRAPNFEAEGGFIIIEVLVSALILAIVAGAVLTLITATTRGAASQRAHAVAYGLAQEAQAEMRTMGIGNLTNLSEAQTKEIGGTNYTVEKQSVYVSDTSQKVSCGSKDTPDYVRLTTTVSAPTMLTPVTIRSVVSPTNGSLDPNVGSLMITAKNAVEDPLPGVQFELKGTNGTSYRGVSESEGCASFGNIPAQMYEVTSSATGLVNKKGESSGSESIEVPTSEIRRADPVYYDIPGWLETEFIALNSVTGSPESAKVNSIQVYNAKAPTSTPKTVVPPGGLPASFLKAESLFPFSESKYTVYAGACEKDNPDPTGTKTANRAAMGFAEVPPGGGPEKPLRIQLPTLGVTVKYGTGTVSGATVTLTDKCGTKWTYYTNSTGQLTATPGGPSERPALPFSTYAICASANLEGLYRKYETSSAERVAVENLTKTGAAYPVDLKSSATRTSISSSNHC
jgi:type II secretory pathway pseudopilin PulG